MQHNCHVYHSESSLPKASIDEHKNVLVKHKIASPLSPFSSLDVPVDFSTSFHNYSKFKKDLFDSGGAAEAVATVFAPKTTPVQSSSAGTGISPENPLR